MRQTVRLIHPQQHTTYPPVCRLQDAAWNYVYSGWRILPLYGLMASGSCMCGKVRCARPGQHIRYQENVQLAISNLTTVQRWWEEDEHDNIGIVTGDGLLVIEIDPLRGGSLEHFRQLYAVPETAMARTEHGRWHLYFTYTRTLTLCTTHDKLGPGIGTYGEGSYVVAPPSILPGGMTRWHDNTPPVRLPAVLLPFLLSSQLKSPSWSLQEQHTSSAIRTLLTNPHLWQAESS
ncbi:hypothetical protein KDA_19240 [Dictyobacter alpinus]|uniref:DNA primase/polymerase bifunctional N-terminal domain-containing protein n=1 Tax=Dictyobacter alpinus TaxID=2014873 RepID=A0A402B519_9CHLR|nr:bifunctional DNA primase/polymerase [Dictyobacter alpinus]GCE26440.1 hypothetical protein KDA_19240 [Dictyobacter alpinus]